MNNNQIRKCKYCYKPLDKSLHGNRNYCKHREGAKKLSCKSEQEKLMKKKREEIKEIETKLKTKLQYGIELLLDDKEQVDLSPEQFEKYLDPFLNIFESITLPEDVGILYLFEEYELYKKGGSDCILRLSKKVNYDK